MRKIRAEYSWTARCYAANFFFEIRCDRPICDCIPLSSDGKYRGPYSGVTSTISPRVNCLSHPDGRSQEGLEAPWNTFATKMAVGMGQMETKVFPAMFPDDFEASVEALLRAETLLVVETHCYIPHQQFPSPGRNTREDRPPHVLTGRYIL